MKINITIAEDAELRAFIKEQVRGAVKSITREEILAMIVVEISAKNNTRDLNSIFDAEMRKQVKALLAGNAWTKSELEVVLRQEIKTALVAHFGKL